MMFSDRDMNKKFAHLLVKLLELIENIVAFD